MARIYLIPDATQPISIQATMIGGLLECAVTAANLIGILAGQSRAAPIDKKRDDLTYVNSPTTI